MEQRDKIAPASNYSTTYGSPEAKQIIKSIRNMNNTDLSRVNTNDQSLKEKLSKIIGQNKGKGSVLKTKQPMVVRVIPF